MNLRVELEQEEDGRWIAEVPDLPGVLAYGSSQDEARARAQALALRVLADRRPIRTRFLILGSASPDMLRQGKESLAGRIAYYPLDGFSL